MAALLPDRIQLPDGGLTEVIMDVARPPRCRFADGTVEKLHPEEVTAEELAAICGHSSLTAWSDERAGLVGTMHWLSRIREPQSDLVLGVTLRLGRHVRGATEPIARVLHEGASLMLVGPAFCGKSTVLREAARILADAQLRRVFLVDTFGAIAGWGGPPDPSAGLLTRRVQPAPDECQSTVLRRTLRHHEPEVLVVDELGERDVQAALEAQRRGVTVLTSLPVGSLEALLDSPWKDLRNRFVVAEMPRRHGEPWRVHAKGQVPSRLPPAPRQIVKVLEQAPMSAAPPSGPPPPLLPKAPPLPSQAQRVRPASPPPAKKKGTPTTAKAKATGAGTKQTTQPNLPLPTPTATSLLSLASKDRPLMHVAVESWVASKTDTKSLPKQLRKLRAAGGDINERGVDGSTCLHRLVQGIPPVAKSNKNKNQRKKELGYLKSLADALVDAGADPSLRDTAGRTPGDFLKGQMKNTLLMTVLLRKPLDPDEPSIFD